MAFFGPNDWGFDPVRHDLFIYGDDGTGVRPEQKVVGWNTQNKYMSLGYDFSCVSIQDRSYSNYYPMHRFGVLHRSFHQEAQSWTARMPRVTAIGKRWAIGVAHYTWTKSCAAQDSSNPRRVYFMLPNGERIEREVDVVRILPNKNCNCYETPNGSPNGCGSESSCRSCGGLISGINGCYKCIHGCPEDVCNLPHGKIDPLHDNINVRANCDTDTVLIRLTEDLPDSITIPSLPTESFFHKWIEDPTGDTVAYPPELQQSERSFIFVDQHMRTGVQQGKSRAATNTKGFWCDDGGLNGDEGCDDGIVWEANSYNLSWNNILSNTGGSSSSSWTTGESVDLDLNLNSSYRERPSRKTSPDSWFDDYTPRDEIGGLYLGDSSSPTFYPLPDGRLLFVGITTSTGGIPWATLTRNMVDVIKTLFDEYEDEHPDFVEGSDVDLSSNTRPFNVDGYRIYKSTISNQGPFFEITSQYDGQLDGGDFICTGNQNDVSPCIRLGNSFMDIEVMPGQQYHYYVTSVNLYDSEMEIYESLGSDIITTTVPQYVSSLTDKLYFDPEDTISTLKGADTKNYAEGIVPAINPIYLNIIDGYNLGDSNSTIPFFGYQTPFDSPINPPIFHDDFPIYYKIQGGDLENNEEVLGIPMPTSPESYQYILGYRYDSEDVANSNANNKFSIGSHDVHINELRSYLDSIDTLWLSRQFKSTNNDYLRSKLEPYYQSKVYFNNLKGLKKLVINPARYGNGRDEYGEDWSYCEGRAQTDLPESYLGYYSGVYLVSDLEPIYSTIETLVAKDSNLDSGCQSMDYFNISEMPNLDHLDLSHNEILRLDHAINPRLKTLDLSFNKIGSSNIWIEDESFPNRQEILPILSNYFILLEICNVSSNNILNLHQPTDFLLVQSNLKNLNASNNPRLGEDRSLGLFAPKLIYLDLSKTSLKNGVVFKNAKKVKNILMRECGLSSFSVSQDTSPLTFAELTNLDISSSSGEFKTLNLKHTKQANWYASGGVGNYWDYGHSAFNLKVVDVSNCPALENLYLPSPQDSYLDFNKQYLEVINISNTSLGVNGSLNNIFSDDVFNPDFYPADHILEVTAKNITDSSGNNCFYQIQRYNELVNRWRDSGKHIILDVDTVI